MVVETKWILEKRGTISDAEEVMGWRRVARAELLIAGEEMQFKFAGLSGDRLRSAVLIGDEEETSR